MARTWTRSSQFCTILPQVYFQWRKLIVQHAVKGIPAHDARIAAAMQVQGVTRILTYNPRDFNRYDGITPVHPGDLK